MPLAKTGDSDRRQIPSEYTLVARREIVGLRVRSDHELDAVMGPAASDR
jgi:hypothetical protein